MYMYMYELIHILQQPENDMYVFGDPVDVSWLMLGLVYCIHTRAGTPRDK